MTGRIVLVTGATGFVGQAVVRELLEKGIRVRALARTLHPEDSHHPLLERRMGDVCDMRSLETLMAGVTDIIHLATLKNDEKESANVNIGGAQNIIEAARIAGVRCIVNVSTQSAKLPHRGIYGETKRMADELFHASGLPVVTLRCSLIYGDTQSGVFGSIVRYAALPAVPLIGDGTARFRPIHRDDVARIIVACLSHPEALNHIYDVGGPELVSLHEITTMILAAQDIQRPIMHIPTKIGLAAAYALSIVPKPPLTISNVYGAAADVPMDIEPLNNVIGDQKIRTFSTGLKEIFGEPPSPQEREARALLIYILSSVGRWEPSATSVKRYIDACTAHGLSEHVLNENLLRSQRKIASVDILSRLLYPQSLFQKKILIAAAIAETDPASAPVLLPQDRSLFQIIVGTFDICASIVWSGILSLTYIVRPSLLRAHAHTL